MSLKYLKFLATATNQHGVHSPFVFDYITKCIYRKKIYRKSKSIDILLKSIDYFGYGKLQLHESVNLKRTIAQRFPEIEYDRLPADLIFYEDVPSKLFAKAATYEMVGNDSMVFIHDIHRNSKTTDLWTEIIGEEIVTVSIDFFHCGAIFFRKEQVKEHFKIRI